MKHLLVPSLLHNTRARALGVTALAGLSLATAVPAAETLAVHREQQIISGVPTVLVWCDQPRQHPLLVLSHGFSGDKARIAAEFDADALARRGWLVAAIDNRMHGERPGRCMIADEDAHTRSVDLLELRQAISDTAADVSSLLDILVLDARVDAGRIAMTGISMGGFITFAATERDSRIRAAAPLIASPFWDETPRDTGYTFLNAEAASTFAATRHPGGHPDRFAPRALFVQVGADDRHFDVARVEAFCREAAQHYRHLPDRLDFRSYPGVAHTATPAMRAAAIDWLERTVGLGGGRPIHPPVEPRSRLHEATCTVPWAPEAVFPLLCPVLEYAWLPGWRCELLRSASGVAELECVFQTGESHEDRMTWVVSRYEPPLHIEFTCFIPGNDLIMRLGIELRPNADGSTSLNWRRHWIATGAAGADAVDRIDLCAEEKRIEWLGRMLDHYLRTGAMPSPEKG